MKNLPLLLWLVLLFTTCSKSPVQDRLPAELRNLHFASSDREIHECQLSEEYSIISMAKKRTENSVFAVLRKGKTVLLISTVGNGFQSSTIVNGSPEVITDVTFDALKGSESVNVLRNCLDKESKPVVLQYHEHGEIATRSFRN